MFNEVWSNTFLAVYRLWKVPHTFVAGLLLEVYVNFQSLMALLERACAIETLDLPTG